MILDGFLMFTGGSGGIGNNDGATDSPTTGTQASSNVIDIGVGSASAPALPSGSAGGGARDLGIGDDPALKILVNVTVALTGGTNMATSLQAAPDSGSNTPGAYVTIVTGPTVVEANLIAGARLLEIDMPRATIGIFAPRYLRLSFVSSGTHGAGKVEGTIVLDRMDSYIQSNGVMGGYPAGITVAN